MSTQPAGQARSARFEPLSGADKPDSKPYPFDLGSPVSPLRPRSAATGGATSSSTTSSSSSAASGGAAAAGRRSHSGELSSPNPNPNPRPPPSHRRSGSGPILFSGATSASANPLPAGNICPSGKIGKISPKPVSKSDVLGSGNGNYGHGSVMRGASSMGFGKLGGKGVDVEEMTRAGNEWYKKGEFAEALRFYDSAVAVCPENAACRSNRAAALMGLGKVGEAVRECEEAVRIDPGNGRAHYRLACLSLRLGEVENARKHFFLTGQSPDPVDLHKLQEVERHLARCGDARKIRDWKSVLREADAAIANGVDSSSLLSASRAEGLLHLYHLEEADSVLSSSPKFETLSSSSSAMKFFGIPSSCFFNLVQAQVDMALGRFENAVAAAEQARKIDSKNIEVTMVLNNVKSVVRARTHGNELFKSGRFTEACAAYGDGLKYDPSNPMLFCNRAASRSKLGQWDKAIEDCNEALRIHPKYTKALLRRADSFAKLERWTEAVRDYEVLTKELTGDTEVAESLFHAQVALKLSRGEEVSNMKFGGEVEEVTSVEQFRAAISLPGASVVYFMENMNHQCSQITQFVDSLCNRYPSANFLKVDIKQSPLIAKAESVRIVPTFKIYKNGTRVKEMICPSQQVLEYSVRHYSI